MENSCDRLRVVYGGARTLYVHAILSLVHMARALSIQNGVTLISYNSHVILFKFCLQLNQS